MGMRFSRRTAVPILIAVIAILFWVAVGSNTIGLAYQRDFLSFYTGAVMARAGHFHELFQIQAQVAVQDALVPNLTVHYPWVRPPFYALMLAPFAMLPIQVAFPVWVALEIAGLLVVWVWAWRRFGPESLPYCAFFLPAALGIAHGQDGVVVLLEFLAAWILLERKHDRLAGLVLSLTLFKFHLFLLLPLAFLIRRRWNLLGGYAAGGTLLGALSLALVGSAGLRDYLELLTRKDLGPPSPWMFVGFNSIGLNLGIEAAWGRAILMAIPAILVLWSAWRAESEMRWFWTAVVGSLMFSPHTYEYDLPTLLIPTLLAIFTGQERHLRVAAVAAAVPIAYFFTIAGAPWAIAPSLVVAIFLVVLSGLVPAVSLQGVHRALSREPRTS